MYQNLFHESMSFPETRDTLFLEIHKTTDKNHIDRLKADYAAIIHCQQLRPNIYYVLKR